MARMEQVTASPTRLIHQITSLGRFCKSGVPARVVPTAAGEIWMRNSEAAAAILRLAIENTYMNGKVMPVNGGV